MTFNSEFGDLPLLIATVDGVDSLTVEEDVQGTKEDAECSNRCIVKREIGRHFGRVDILSALASTLKYMVFVLGRGLCDHATGICSCFYGMGSSDGFNSNGDRGDCGYIIPEYSNSNQEANTA